MPWLLGGYMWLYLHRPFEVWPILGVIQLERFYMLGLLACWFVYPGKRWINNRLHAAFLFFTFVLLVCWVSSPFPQELGQKVWDDHWKVGIFFILLVTTIRDEKSLRQMLSIYFFTLFLYQAHSLLEFFNGRYEYRMQTVRMKGVDLTFGDPNTFAATFLHALPFLVPFWMTAKKPWTKPLISGYVGLTLLCILLTGSRRAFLGICFLSFVLLMRSRYRWVFLLLLPLCAPVGWSLLRPDLQNRFLTLLDSSYGPSNAHTSGKFRYTAFFDGLTLWETHPVTGVGPAAFGVAVGHGMQAHNLYAQTLGELGTLGLLALSFTVWAFWWNSRESKRLYLRHRWREDFNYHLIRSTWLAIILLLFMGIGGHNLYRYNWLWFGAFQLIALHALRLRSCADSCHVQASLQPIHPYQLHPSPA